MADAPLTVTIEKLVQGGRGLAHEGSQVLFVRGALPGETVSVGEVTQHKGYREGEMEEVRVASADRVAPPCPVYRTCGGCQLQHVRYETQLYWKREMLAEALARVAKLHVGEIPPVVASPEPYGYRSTVRFVVFKDRHGFRLGFHREGTHDPVEAASCLLIPDALRAVAAAVGERLAHQKRLPLRLESIEIRRSTTFGSVLVICRTGRAERPQAYEVFALFENLPGVTGQVVVAGPGRRWVQGDDWIADRLGELIFRIGDRSFMQANWRLYETIARTVAAWVGSGERLRVLELYGGIGTLGLPLARAGALVTEVEANPYALADARHAAKRNHVGRCRFRPLRAEAMLATVEPGDYDVVLVDPPRTGLGQDCLPHLVRIAAPRLLYLSCDAPTLARDLARLCAGGYRVARIQPFDMFPQTTHLETLVELAR
ncbi:23S rRNA (uracil(1939)-C(5))-methyltransferase RlmD [Nitrospira sp. Kam-Ns4a]